MEKEKEPVGLLCRQCNAAYTPIRIGQWYCETCLEQKKDEFMTFSICSNCAKSFIPDETEPELCETCRGHEEGATVDARKVGKVGKFKQLQTPCSHDEGIYKAGVEVINMLELLDRITHGEPGYLSRPVKLPTGSKFYVLVLNNEEILTKIHQAMDDRYKVRSIRIVE